MDETAKEKEDRERKEMQAARIAGLKRSKGGPTEVSGTTEGEEQTIDSGGSGGNRGSVIRRRTVTGFNSADQAKALDKPVEPTGGKTPTKPKGPADMTDAELDAAAKTGNLAAGAERNRRKTSPAGKK